MEETILSWLFIFGLLEAPCGTSGVPAAARAQPSSNNCTFCQGSTYFWPCPFISVKGSLGQTVGLWQGALNTHSPFPLFPPPPNQQPVINSCQMLSHSPLPSRVHTAPRTQQRGGQAWIMCEAAAERVRLLGSGLLHPTFFWSDWKKACFARLANACLHTSPSPRERQAIWPEPGLCLWGQEGSRWKTDRFYCLCQVSWRAQVTHTEGSVKMLLPWEILKIGSGCRSLQPGDQGDCLGFSFVKALRMLGWSGMLPGPFCSLAGPEHPMQPLEKDFC